MTETGILILYIAIIVFVFISAIVLCNLVAWHEEKIRKERERIEKLYLELESNALKTLGYINWPYFSQYDAKVIVKSRQTLEKYDIIKFFKDNKDKLVQAQIIIKNKKNTYVTLKNFLKNNEYKQHELYDRLVKQIDKIIWNTRAYIIHVEYISAAGNCLDTKYLLVTQYDIDKFDNDPSLLMTKSEYSQYLKNKQQEALNKKQHIYYDGVNQIIDYANENREKLFVKGSQDRVDGLVEKLFDRTVNSIKKIKSVDSEEWSFISTFMENNYCQIKQVVDQNKRIIDYYESNDFKKIKETCAVLMNSQKEFNEYIIEKVNAISKLFGTKVVRSETINEDEYQYIRPYKKTITPFTAEVSAAVFSSAENNPLEYVVKHFYPDKEMYPEQIQKLHLLIEELATLKDAKQIIENYKIEYKQYLNEVPNYIMEEDESGFYSRLGFANIDESALVIEYKFSYTSNGGMAKRTFTVPMTDDTIVDLIKRLEGKLTVTKFTKEQRTLMTSKLREIIKKRDDFTCRMCGNSTHTEPNLLLEIDHIVPISRGGHTVEENLQTLCWKCNRSKSNRIVV